MDAGSAEIQKGRLTRRRLGKAAVGVAAGGVAVAAGMAFLDLQGELGQLKKHALIPTQNPLEFKLSEDPTKIVVEIEVVPEGNSKTITVYRDAKHAAREKTPLRPDELRPTYYAVRRLGEGYSSLNPQGRNYGAISANVKGEKIPGGLWFELTDVWGNPADLRGYRNPGNKPFVLRATSVNVLRSVEPPPLPSNPQR